MGTPITRLRVIRSYVAGKYRDVVPPVPNKNFTNYSVRTSPRTGVCAIFAETPRIYTPDTVRGELLRIVKLMSKYGIARNGELSDVPIEIIAQYGLKGYYAAYWVDNLPNKLVRVEANIDGTGDAFGVTVTYTYANYTTCSNWEPGQDRSGL